MQCRRGASKPVHDCGHCWNHGTRCDSALPAVISLIAFHCALGSFDNLELVSRLAKHYTSSHSYVRVHRCATRSPLALIAVGRRFTCTWTQRGAATSCSLTSTRISSRALVRGPLLQATSLKLRGRELQRRPIRSRGRQARCCPLALLVPRCSFGYAQFAACASRSSHAFCVVDDYHSRRMGARCRLRSPPVRPRTLLPSPNTPSSLYVPALHVCC